jgi:flagellar hook-basal body complex protein FliE
MNIMQVDKIGSGFEERFKTESKPNHASSQSEKSFADQLKTTFDEVNQIQAQADEAMAKGAVQGSGGIHETMIKLEEADISLRLLLKVRTKALEAYNEVMRMQF